MPIDLISLCIIVLVAALCPIAAKLVPNKLVPEAVFLLIAGALLGPHLGGIIDITDSVSLLSDLGLAFLFLLAGYEIDPKSLTGSQGKRGLATWLITFALAFAAVMASRAFSDNHLETAAMAIVLTTTALGTLMPIMKERGLMGTTVGDSILAYGTWGELGPVLAMALLLSTRAEWKTILILVGFMALCVVMAVVPAKAKKAGHRLFSFLTANANTTSQTMMRVTILLMVGLITLSAVFDLDIVLGAFASGFVLRYIIPEGNETLELKLDGVGYGFLIPVFFVVSGAKINLLAVFDQPLLLVSFIVMLLLIRAVPVFVALSTGKDTRNVSTHNRLTVALYCTTALPVIVAVTSVAVSAGAMSQDMASVLVAAGAVTVFLMPMLASITYRVSDAKPIEAVKEIRQNPRDIGDILREHWELERLLARQEAAARISARRGSWENGATPWQDAAFALQRQSARKQALDEALDLAAQEVAASKAAVDGAADKRGAPAIELLVQRREERRRRLAQHALREHNRRMAEVGRASAAASDVESVKRGRDEAQTRESGERTPEEAKRARE